MALNSIIHTSVTGLLTNQEALRVTSNNITNVNTPDYARQVVSTEANVNGGLSSGVSIAAIERVVDKFLDAATLRATSDASQFSAMRDIHERLQSALGRPDSETSLSARMNKVFTALGGLAFNPSDSVTRQQFLSDLQAYTEEAARIANELQSLRADTSRQIESQVGSVNEALRQIFELNVKILDQRGRGGDVAGLENQRQAALTTLSKSVDIRILENGDGSISVNTLTGAQLVTPAFYTALRYEGPGVVSAETKFPPITVQRVDPSTGQPAGTPRVLDGDIRSGALRGLLDMRDRQLVDLSVALGELSARVADEFNAVHNLNTAVPPPNQLVGKTTAYTGTDLHHFTGSVTFAVVDTAEQVVAKTTYDFDANPGATLADMISAVNAGLGGAATLSLSGGVMSLVAANANDGVVIAEDPNNTSQRAGRSFAHFFGMNDLLTARSPGLFETGVAATDAHNIQPGGQMDFKVRDAFGRTIVTFSLDTDTTTTYADVINALNAPTALGTYFTFALDAKGVLSATPTGALNGVALDVVNDTTQIADTGVSLSVLFGLGDQHRANAAVDMRPAEGVPDNAGLLATARLDLTAGVGQVALAPGDQTGALALQQLENKVISTAAAGELAAQSRTLSSFNAAVLGNFAVSSDRVITQAEDSESLRLEVDLQRQSVSGVNLDEELANLVVFQNSYNAAARMLSTVQELFDALLTAV
ncbi:MAG: flagellar hook-associated protein FlgK [Alphaproteobacteria bacterium]|nr:MAG: flagellar hook-associated protein FlgK [Alphaproteobacteria bacterium]